MDKTARPVISVVIPAYNEEGNITALYESLIKTAANLPYDFKFVFVDDCSKDKTADILDGLRKKDPRMDIIRFSRNYGSHAAISAGLLYSQGDAAMIIAADLQDPPDIVVPKMLAEWRKGYRVVWGVRDERKGERFSTILFSRLFYFLMNSFTSAHQPPSGIGAILLDSVVVETFNKSSEKNASVAMLIAWMGFSQSTISYVRQARHSGKSKWTFTKKLKLSIDSFISFSYLPMRFMSLLGMLCTIFGLIYCADIVVSKTMKNIAVEGWSSLMIVILLIGGIQMIMLGILGEYLWRTYDEVRKRPGYIIERNTISEKQKR